MSQAIYTKYRPQKWSDVIGQEQVTDVLKDSIKNGNIAHAYLFSGSRGTGKTSVARILAREIGTSQKDLYEIDAASNNGVDEIRTLKDSVLSLPFDSKYKIYIFDEVHMLSKPAFNALLKTLEEPPKHVIFILATTEPEKIPTTVISRCETYSFKTPNRAVLKKLIIQTVKSEGYELESDAAELISILSDGSFRDAHTTLQKIIAVSADKKLTADEVEKVTGAPKNSLINDFVAGILEKDLEKSLIVLKNAEENNLDNKVFMKLVLEKLRAGLILKIASNKKDLYADSISEDDMKFLENLVSKNPENINSKVLTRMLDAYSEINKSHLPYLTLEIAISEIK